MIISVTLARLACLRSVISALALCLSVAASVSAQSLQSSAGTLRPVEPAGVSDAAARNYDAALQAQRAGQSAQAHALLESALQHQPLDLRLRFLYGVVLSDLKRATEAEAVFRGLTESFPEVPEPYNNLAVLLLQRGDWQGARDALDMALRVAPDYVVALENLGDLYLYLAHHSYQKALQSQPQQPILLGKIVQLTPLIDSLEKRTLPPTQRPGAQP